LAALLTATGVNLNVLGKENLTASDLPSLSSTTATKLTR
jgi:hypothetical protein